MLSPATDAVYKALGYHPHPEQLTIHEWDSVRKLICGGAQGGKTVTLAKELWNRKRWGEAQRFAILAEDYKRTERCFFYLRDDAIRLDLMANDRTPTRADPGELRLIDGTIIETKTAGDPRTLAMYSYDGIIIDEASQVNYEVYERAEERVAGANGFIVMGGTLEGSGGWYPSLWRAWQHGSRDAKSFSLPMWANRALFPGGRDDPKIRAMETRVSDRFFMERIAGEPVPPQGLVFPEFRPDIHIRDLEWLPELPVFMWIDPGFNDACAYMFAQELDGQIRVFQEIYERGKTVDDIVAMVRDLPWYGNITHAVEDTYGDQHHHVSSVAERWQELTGMILRSNRVRSRNDADERLRWMLQVHPLSGKPRIVFDVKCKGILSEFGAYMNPFDGQLHAYSWKTDREGNLIGTTPNTGVADHAITAIEFGLIDRFGYADIRPFNPTVHVKRWQRGELVVKPGDLPPLPELHPVKVGE